MLFRSVRTIREHKRIIFNGNNYSEDWIREAEKRGLLRLDTTVDALPCYTAEKNIRLPEGLSLKKLRITHPWNRLFECKIDF